MLVNLFKLLHKNMSEISFDSPDVHEYSRQVAETEISH